MLPSARTPSSVAIVVSHANALNLYWTSRYVSVVLIFGCYCCCSTRAHKIGSNGGSESSSSSSDLKWLAYESLANFCIKSSNWWVLCCYSVRANGGMCFEFFDVDVKPFAVHGPHTRNKIVNNATTTATTNHRNSYTQCKFTAHTFLLAFLYDFAFNAGANVEFSLHFRHTHTHTRKTEANVLTATTMFRLTEDESTTIRYSKLFHVC